MSQTLCTQLFLSVAGEVRKPVVIKFHSLSLANLNELPSQTYNESRDLCLCEMMVRYDMNF